MASTNFQPGTVVQSSWAREVDQAVFPYLTAVSGTNTITAVGPVTYTAYLQQQGGFILNPQNSNTGATTININGLGAVPITKYGTSPLVASDLAAGVIAYIVYDGVRFQLLNPQTVAARISGRLIGTQTFTANGTYTPTAGTTRIMVEAVGGGGAGGGTVATAAGNFGAGGGGGSGGYAKTFLTTGFSGASVTIGTAGAGVNGANGGNGGNTLFGAVLVAGGGSGGLVSATSTAPNSLGGAGGVSSVGTVINGVGERGNNGWGIFGSSILLTGQGGSSSFGQGGPSIQTTATGAAAVGFGGGGGGAGALASVAAQTGGAGSPGILIVYEYS